MICANHSSGMSSHIYISSLQSYESPHIYINETMAMQLYNAYLMEYEKSKKENTNWCGPVFNPCFASLFPKGFGTGKEFRIQTAHFVEILKNVPENLNLNITRFELESLVEEYKSHQYYHRSKVGKLVRPFVYNLNSLMIEETASVSASFCKTHFDVPGAYEEILATLLGQ